MPARGAAPTPIFLFSLPRSGSTLCQRILAAHPDVATANEPHFLLPLLYSLKEEEVRSTYGHLYAAQAVQDFCRYLPGGTDDYLGAIRDSALDVYRRACPCGERYFLDKTPKYHYLVDDLPELFPDAALLFLWRNPLAVLASLIETWGGGRWNAFYFKSDLYRGVERLVDGYLRHEGRAFAIQYRDAVRSPAATWEAVFAHLDLAWDPTVLESFAETRLEGRVRDPNADLREYQVIADSSVEKWKRVLNTPLRRAWARRYVRWIGAERLAVMGFDLDDLLAELDALETTLDHVVDDAWRMPWGAAHHAFELVIMKEKLRAWRRGERAYMHS